MTVLIRYKNLSHVTIRYVESIRQMKDGIETQTFGNESVLHRNVLDAPQILSLED